MSPNSPLYGQAAAAQPPMLPHELLHKVVSLALDRESPEAAAVVTLGLDEQDNQEDDDDADFFDDLDEYEASELDGDEELVVSEGGEDGADGVEELVASKGEEDGGDGEQAGEQQLQTSL
jgi:hypothetical protein